ncbi:uncharacterized protein LOC143082786 isoform X2 [Mytilus galloprovincialis]|uniref:uncharacterized protein LOC143082786 isoform X2 n=1 Tax=Mytilus galloprovincialis TaxID=29158 RepID=UPI003F7BF597
MSKRKAYLDHRGIQRVDLPDSVSEWERCHLEDLNIFYAEDFANDPLEILKQINTLTDFDEDQLSYIHSVKELLKFNASVLKLKFQRSVVESTISLLYEKLTKDPNMNISTTEQTTWTNLRGMTVRSDADLHLFKLGLRQERTDTCVSIVKVKNIKTTKRNQERPQQRRKRMRGSTLDISESSSDTSDSSTDSEGYNIRRPVYSTEDKHAPPLILDITNERAIGQHGGELLLNLNKFYGDSETDTLKLFGMIVIETSVIFTLLEMSKKHLEKLRNNEELDNQDEATIYYSPPYDILCEESRNILIENFMRLNNVNV